MERIPLELSGVPETLLGNLGRRAAAARSGALKDPMAIKVVDRLDYDFADFARGANMHVVRVATFDQAVRHFLGPHPTGTVVALGEGLETQFWRVDNGQVRWLTVDLPEAIELRHRLLPDGPRRSSHSGSALDLDWLAGLDPAGPILVTAQGLFPYFQRDQVHWLIAEIAERLPGSQLVFDVVPEAMLEMVRRASGRERDLAVELWTWLFNARERAAISTLPGVEQLRDLASPLTPGLTAFGVAAVSRLPTRIRYLLPVIRVLQASFARPPRTESASETRSLRSARDRLTPAPTRRRDSWTSQSWHCSNGVSRGRTIVFTGTELGTTSVRDRSACSLPASTACREIPFGRRSSRISSASRIAQRGSQRDA